MYNVVYIKYIEVLEFKAIVDIIINENNFKTCNFMDTFNYRFIFDNSVFQK